MFLALFGSSTQLSTIPTYWATRTDEWIRRRIRQLLWKQWKKASKRYEEIKKRCKSAPLLGEYAYTSNRYWRMSMTPLINKALSKKTLLEEGWFSISLVEGQS